MREKTFATLGNHTIVQFMNNADAKALAFAMLKSRNLRLDFRYKFAENPQISTQAMNFYEFIMPANGQDWHIDIVVFADGRIMMFMWKNWYSYQEYYEIIMPEIEYNIQPYRRIYYH